MTWKELLRNNRVERHQTSADEVMRLRGLIQRDLEGAQIEELSDDRKFATTYSAVLQAAKLVIACAGYRVKAAAHHYTTFQALKIAMGKEVVELSTYFDICRRKRNILDYDNAHVVTETETKELLNKALEFGKKAEQWIKHHRPELAKKP